MSWLTYPDGADPASYHGLPEMYEYVNGDGLHRKFNCGQAAACTLLTHYRILPNGLETDAARPVMCEVEGCHPPDNLGGWFGTSRRRVERICRTHDLPVELVEGEAELRHYLATSRPVILMVGTEGPKFGPWHAPSGHWMVAYGYDDAQLFLTNYSSAGMPWPEFRRAWRALVPKLISMRNLGLAAVTQIADEPVGRSEVAVA